MSKIDVLSSLNAMQIGKSVAEQDDELAQYFIETEAFKALVAGTVDVIAGDKGTGKSAIYRMLQQNYRRYPELEKIEVVSAFNPTGNPIFQRLTTGMVHSEGAYRTVWKAYFLSLVGNWLVDIFGEHYNAELNQLNNVLIALDLKSKSLDPRGIFGKIANFFSNLGNVKKATVEFSVTEAGMPIVIPGIEFYGIDTDGGSIYCDDFLRVLENALGSCDVVVWLALDRLDEAFVGFPDVETPALRALLRTYLDLTGFKNLRLKLFLRRDLFRRVTSGGFVNLSHINAMRIDIEWQDEDLIAMLEKRLSYSQNFLRSIGVENAESGYLFSRMFPSQIDLGSRKPSAQNWIMSRIKDGKGIKPPRNLLDLAIKSRENQLRREQRDSRGQIDENYPIIEAESVKLALKQLSQIRVDDTLLAEAGPLALEIEKFKDSKSEHNNNTLADVLGMQLKDSKSVVKLLVEMGFLEELSGTYKIPMLFRDGLNITQGKAF